MRKIWEKIKKILMGDRSFIIMLFVLIVLLPFWGGSWNLILITYAVRSVLYFKSTEGVARSAHGLVAFLLLAAVLLDFLSALFNM